MNTSSEEVIRTHKEKNYAVVMFFYYNADGSTKDNSKKNSL